MNTNLLLENRELLELAAKALGYNESQIYPGYDGGLLLYELNDTSFMTKISWNPLYDDGDALRLAVSLNLLLIFNPALDQAIVRSYYVPKLEIIEKSKDYNNNCNMTMRYAIVKAASKHPNINTLH